MAASAAEVSAQAYSRTCPDCGRTTISLFHDPRACFSCKAPIGVALHRTQTPLALPSFRRVRDPSVLARTT